MDWLGDWLLPGLNRVWYEVVVVCLIRLVTMKVTRMEETQAHVLICSIVTMLAVKKVSLTPT